MPFLNTTELLLVRKIIIFYMTHHMGQSNPQYKEVNTILDKITDSINK